MIGQFASKLKQLRLDKHLRQEQVAALIGVTKSAVSAYENDLRQPSYSILVRLATLYRVSTDYLLGYKGFVVWKVNTKRCQEIYSDFMDKPILEYQTGIGYILKSIIDGNAERRSLQDTQHLEHFKELSEITLLYDAPDISSQLPSAKSYQDRLADEVYSTDVVIIED